MRTATLASLFALILTALVAVPAAAQEDVAKSAEPMAVIELSREMNLAAFLELVSVSTHKSLLFDPNAQRIRNQKMGSDIKFKVPKDRLFDTYRAMLSFYELTLVPVGPASANLHLVIDSRSTNNFIKNKATFVAPEDVPALADRDGMYIATIFPIQHVANMTTLRTALSTMVSPAGIGRVTEVGGVGIIVMDFAPTVAGIQNLLRRIDIPNGDTMEMASIELNHAKAAEVAATIQAMFPAKAGTSSRNRFSIARSANPIITPFEHRNAIVVRASRQHMAEIRALVVDLDNTPVGKNMIEMVRLQTAQAHIVANTIMAAIRGNKKLASTATVIGDRSTNAIIVSGTPTEVQLVLALIKRLDAPQSSPAK